MHLFDELSYFKQCVGHTSHCLFTQYFTRNITYMTVAQISVTEWDGIYYSIHDLLYVAAKIISMGDAGQMGPKLTDPETKSGGAKKRTVHSVAGKNKVAW